jgi:REP element-mobilizing transposase RayT
MPDHTHILVSIKPDSAISDLVGDIPVEMGNCMIKFSSVGAIYSQQKNTTYKNLAP